MMIRRRQLLSTSSSFVVIIVALAIVVSTHIISTVQAFSSPARYVVGSSTLASRHHRSLLPSSSLSTLPSSIPSQRVHGISSTTTTRYRRHHTTVSTTTRHAASAGAAAAMLNHGISTFTSNWKSYGLIPLVAGFVGWFTNYLAVQMIFYPIKWRGLPIYKVEGEPLGLLGWQGESFVVSMFSLSDESYIISLSPFLD